MQRDLSSRYACPLLRNGSRVVIRMIEHWTIVVIFQVADVEVSGTVMVMVCGTLVKVREGRLDRGRPKDDRDDNAKNPSIHSLQVYII